MPEEFTWGPVGWSKAPCFRMALLPPTPRKYFIGHTFLNLLSFAS